MKDDGILCGNAPKVQREIRDPQRYSGCTMSTNLGLVNQRYLAVAFNPCKTAFVKISRVVNGQIYSLFIHLFVVLSGVFCPKTV